MLWSSACVAGSGHVRACSGETRLSQWWVLIIFYTNSQWANTTSPFDDLWHALIRLNTVQWRVTLQVTFHPRVFDSQLMTRWLLLLFKYHFFWMKMLTVFFLRALVFAYNARVMEGLLVHPSPSRCNVYVSVYVSSCLLSAEQLDTPPSHAGPS